jgi:hypothetical protein
MQIIVVVSGGCVTDVYCEEEADVTLLDFDEAREADGHLPPGEGTAVVEMDHEVDLAEYTMHEVF